MSFMSKIHVTNTMLPDSILLPGAFIKKHMAKASGEFVKIYIYLFYAASQGRFLDLSAAADELLCTEADLIRALKYWEGTGILSLQFDPNGILEELIFADVNSAAQTAPVSRPGTPTIQPQTAEKGKAPAVKKQTIAKPQESVLPEISLDSDENFRELCFLAQAYTKKTLTSRDTQRLGYWYQLYNGSYEIIVYLLEYCVEIGHANFNYMEKVLLNWHESGYQTIDEIKKQGQARNAVTYRVMGAFGLKDRNPGSKESDFIKKWYQTYGFSPEMIEYACQKTLSAIQKPSFEYTDTILTAWHQNGYFTKEDVEAAELLHRQKEAEKETTRKTAKKTPAANNNRFHNFEQHDNDYNELMSDYYGVKL